MKKDKPCIAIIGCGNMAWFIARALHTQYQLQVYNHKPNEALKDFRKSWKAHTYNSFKDASSDVDAVFICVKDSVVKKVVASISHKLKNSVMFITSGNINLVELNSKSKKLAIVYPLLSIRKEQKTYTSNFPVLCESADQTVLAYALKYAKLLKGNPIRVNYQQRLTMHLCAVLVNNFTNSLYVAAHDLLKKQPGAPEFKLLMLLIKEGIHKMEKVGPKAAQTGPALRNDTAVEKKHIALLKDAELRKLYQLFSRLIRSQQNTHK